MYRNVKKIIPSRPEPQPPRRRAVPEPRGLQYPKALAQTRPLQADPLDNTNHVWSASSRPTKSSVSRGLLICGPKKSRPNIICGNPWGARSSISSMITISIAVVGKLCGATREPLSVADVEFSKHLSLSDLDEQQNTPSHSSTILSISISMELVKAVYS